MKKLMVAFAMVVAAVSLQAAQAKWSANNLYVPGSTTDKGAGYIAYLIETSAGLTSSAALDLWKAGKQNELASYFTEGSVATATATGVLNSQAFGNYANGETVSGYAIIFNAGSMADATLAYTTAVGSKATGTSGQTANVAIGNLAGTGASANSQLAESWVIPEPTSGLLLLLGMAGLALKRKQA